MNWDSIEGWFDASDVMEYRRIASRYVGGNFVEIGCWKGRSLSSIMPVLLQNNYNNIYAVDHWLGSVDERAGDHLEATQTDIFPQFTANLASCGFDNKYKVVVEDVSCDRASCGNYRWPSIEISDSPIYPGYVKSSLKEEKYMELIESIKTRLNLIVKSYEESLNTKPIIEDF